jgi:hypothetical protein
LKIGNNCLTLLCFPKSKLKIKHKPFANVSRAFLSKKKQKIKHNIEEEPKLMALPEGTSVTVEGITRQTYYFIPPMKILKVVLEYMGENG